MLEKKASPGTIEAFNITIAGNVPLDQLLPSESLPSDLWLQDPSTNPNTWKIGQPHQKLSNGVPVPGHKTFYARADELRHSMDDISDAISGSRPTPGQNSTQTPIRCVQTRNFFQNLLLMAEFWDTSKDNYIPANNTVASSESTETNASNNKVDTSKETYTGIRHGAPHQMPASYREDTITQFLNLAVWPHHCYLQPKGPRSLTCKLHFQHRLHVQVQHIFTTVCRSVVGDREKARNGILEGPLLGVQCRNTTAFRKENENPGEGREEIMDLLYEVGSALLIAQKRAREGTTEEPAGKDKFWADGTTRHLGEVGGGKQDRETNEQAKQEIFGAMEGVEPSKKDLKEQQKLMVRARPYLAGKPQESLWEAKMEYRMVGKEVGKGYDTVFIVSALNHHISILSVRVYDRYLDFFTNGQHPDPTYQQHGTSTANTTANAGQGTGVGGAGQEWWKLQVKRSKWFDLLDPQDRVEAFRGVWALVGWMMREP